MESLFFNKKFADNILANKEDFIKNYKGYIDKYIFDYNEELLYIINEINDITIFEYYLNTAIKNNISKFSYIDLNYKYLKKFMDNNIINNEILTSYIEQNEDTNENIELFSKYNLLLDKETIIDIITRNDKYNELIKILFLQEYDDIKTLNYILHKCFKYSSVECLVYINRIYDNLDKTNYNITDMLPNEIKDYNSANLSNYKLIDIIRFHCIHRLDLDEKFITCIKIFNFGDNILTLLYNDIINNLKANYINNFFNTDFWSKAYTNEFNLINNLDIEIFELYIKIKGEHNGNYVEFLSGVVFDDIEKERTLLLLLLNSVSLYYTEMGYIYILSRRNEDNALFIVSLERFIQHYETLNNRTITTIPIDDPSNIFNLYHEIN